MLHGVPFWPKLSTSQSTDQELLNFGKDSDDEVDSDGDEEEDGEEAGEGAAEPAAAAKSKSGMEKAGVTLEMVEGWCTAAKENATLGAVRNIIKVCIGSSGSYWLRTEPLQAS